eukprot:1301911-Amphidinium_carterae.1
MKGVNRNIRWGARFHPHNALYHCAPLHAMRVQLPFGWHAYMGHSVVCAHFARFEGAAKGAGIDWTSETTFDAGLVEPYQVNADRVLTVSPNYANEIQSPGGGFGLQVPLPAVQNSELPY